MRNLLESSALFWLNGLRETLAISVALISSLLFFWRPTKASKVGPEIRRSLKFPVPKFTVIVSVYARSLTDVRGQAQFQFIVCCLNLMT